MLDSTPFYAESGGQVGDTGELRVGDAVFHVTDTRRQPGGAFGHHGAVSNGRLALGDEVQAQIDVERRAATMRNHSATHLLHAVLREQLGGHVAQKGSLVAPDRLRFDFSHPEPVTAEQLADIEQRVNARILTNTPADTREQSYDDAIASGAMALFGEKYSDTVRVLQFGEFSTELCGGTHVQRLGDIGLFKITSESGVAAGVRRIEAVTGLDAIDWVRGAQRRLDGVAGLVKSSSDEVEGKVAGLVERTRQLEKELERLKGKLASSQGSDLASQAQSFDGVSVLAARLDGADVKTLRDTVDQLKNKLGTSAVVLGATQGDKVLLIAGVSKDATARIKAGDLVNVAAVEVGGRGGGRPDMAQAGGSEPGKLDAALDAARTWLQNQLATEANA